MYSDKTPLFTNSSGLLLTILPPNKKRIYEPAALGSKRASNCCTAFRWWNRCKETGSGWNGRREARLRIFRNPNVQVIVVEHCDRLMRFGLEYVEAALAAQGRRAVGVDAAERTDDIACDLHEVIVSMCARLYGKRAVKNRAKKAMEAIGCE